MKVNNIRNGRIATTAMFRGSPINKITQFFSKHENVGEASSILIDILGKGLLVPLVIMSNPFSKQSKEDKKYSAIKNPISATIQLGLEVPIFYFASKGARKLANQGLLDKGRDFSYNAKSARDTFIASFDDMLKSSPPKGAEIKHIAKLKQTLSKTRPPRKTIQELNQIISSSSTHLKQQAKKSLDNFNTTHKRLFHLESRFSFIVAMLAIPFVCALENWLHPKVMEFINKKDKDKDEEQD